MLELWAQKFKELNIPPTQQRQEVFERLFDATQHSEEWAHTKTGAHRAWYVCRHDRGGRFAPCGTAMPAKQLEDWFDKKEESERKWYCVCCRTRSRPTYGMPAELHHNGQYTRMRIEVAKPCI